MCARCGQPGSHQHRGQAEKSRAERRCHGDRADQERTAGVAEFTADLGRPHGLPQPFRRCAGGEVGEAERGRQPIRYERKPSHFLAFLTLGAAITCYKKLAK
jgi:hypothetical protein